MRKIINFGSINLDHVYNVENFVQPGETITVLDLHHFPGGKGLNQSIAGARSGVSVCHAGNIGEDGLELAEMLEKEGVDCRFVRKSKLNTGHAVIQVNKKGQNCILVYDGANKDMTSAFIDSVLDAGDPEDIVLLQNEINNIDYIISEAHRRGYKIALNPSPINEKILKCPLGLVDYLILNEVEGNSLTGETDEQKIITELLRRNPDARIVLTLGKKGVVYADASQQYRHGTYDVPVVDTTAAGDTFTGFFLGAVIQDLPIPEALRLASVASSIAVSRQGASVSIPGIGEVRAANLTLSVI